MKLHKEGYGFLTLLLGLFISLNVIVYHYLAQYTYLCFGFSLATFLVYLFFVQFFRFPYRIPTISDKKIVCPADGKVVVIEEVEEPEYFKDKRIQVSIFMSPFNVHINWSPVAGILKYYRYYKGLFLVAWHPKSSTDNERNTMVFETQDNQEVLMRQIAGAVARRIIFYKEEGNKVGQSEQVGFIKFGSRVDLFLPLGTKINVQLEEKVQGRTTIIGELP